MTSTTTDPDRELNHYELVHTASGAPALVVDHDDTGDMPLLYTMRQYPKRVLYILVTLPAILLVGYDVVIVSALASMPYFDYIYGAYYVDPVKGLVLFIPATWLGLWNGLGAIGSMAGSMWAGWVHDRFGRKASLASASILTAVGVAIIYGSAFCTDLDTKRGIFLLGKIISGFAVGQVAATTQTYLSEITPHSLRGPTFALFPMLILAGQLIGAGIVFKEIYIIADTGFKTCMLSMFAFSGATLIVSFVIPESPTWLVRSGKVDAACKSEKRLERAGVDSDLLVQELLTVIEQEKHESRSGSKVSIVQCFQGENSRRTWLVIFANSLPNMFGLAFLATSTYFYELLGMEAGLAIKLLEIGIGVGMAANFISIWTTTKFARRPLIIVTMLVISLLWLGIGISGCFKTTAAIRYWSAAAMILVIFLAGLGVWPASVAVASEASSLRLRGQAQAVGWIWQNLVSGVLGIVLPYIYTPNQGNSQGKIGFLFFGTALIGAGLAWLYVPEMKGRTASEIDAMFHAKIPARRFTQWTPEETFGPMVASKAGVVHVEKVDA